MASIHPSAIVSESATIKGDACIIGAGAILGDNCCIDENVRIGSGAIIGENIYVGKNSIIEAGAVVTLNIPEGVVVAGNPAKCTGRVPAAGARREIKYAIPHDARWNYCQADSCRRMIYWIITAAGKRMPVDPDGTPHFATCPAAGRFRSKRKLHS